MNEEEEEGGETECEDEGGSDGIERGEELLFGQYVGGLFEEVGGDLVDGPAEEAVACWVGGMLLWSTTV